MRTSRLVLLAIAAFLIIIMIARARAGTNGFPQQCTDQFGLGYPEGAQTLGNYQTNRLEFMGRLNALWPFNGYNSYVGDTFQANSWQLCALYLISRQSPAPDENQPIDSSAILSKDTLVKISTPWNTLCHDAQMRYKKIMLNGRSFALPDPKSYTSQTKNLYNGCAQTFAGDGGNYAYKIVTLRKSVEDSSPWISFIVNNDYGQKLPQILQSYLQDIAAADAQQQAQNPAPAGASSGGQSQPAAGAPAPHGFDYSACNRSCGNDSACQANCASNAQ